MSFSDRYEYEQIVDRDLAMSRNQWQVETETEKELKRFLNHSYIQLLKYLFKEQF